MVPATAPKPPYDPVKALEGMFNGSVTRIAYVLKDPVNYGSSTQIILAESAKRFQDALDDCEIQLLEAKWYLEQQLAINRARREATITEADRNAAKRKRQEIEEAAKLEEAANTPKRRKSSKDDAQNEPQQLTPSGILPSEADAKQVDEQKAGNTEQKAIPEREERTQSQPTPTQPTKVPSAVEEPQQPIADEFPKETPRNTPAGTNDDFFVSMFGDPSADANEDVNFDMTVGDAYDNINDSEPQDLSSLNTLLPGLESYANQLGDDDNLNNNTTSTTAPSDAPPAFSNSFDLPEIGGNMFDDFLNDDSLGNSNFDGGVDLTDEAFNNMQFDDMFGP